MIEHRGGSETRAEVAEHLHRATGGNPFFVDEVLRMLVSEGRLEILTDDPVLPLRVPIGVQALIEQRLADMPEETVQALRSGAVIGDRFSVATLAEATGRPRAELVTALEAAIEAQLLDVAPGEVAKFGFLFHDLIRETAYAGLGSLERARTHAAVGEALARRYRRRDRPPRRRTRPPLPQGAARGRSGDRGRLRRARRRPRDGALRPRAGRPALRLRRGSPRAGRRALRDRSLAAPLGAAARPGPGSTADGRRARAETLLEAADAARTAGSPEAVANVALAFGAFALSPRRVDEELTGLLEEALAGIAGRDCVLRVHLLGRLARALYWSEETEPRRALIDEAIAMARRLGDEEALGIALGNCIPASRGPDTAELELSWIDELLSLSKTPGRARRTGTEHRDRPAARERCDRRGRCGDRQPRTPCRRLRDLRARAYVPAHRARRAMMDGRYDDAQRLIAEAVAISQDVEESTIPLIAAGQLFTLSWTMGRPGGVEQQLRQIAEALPYVQCGDSDWR